MYVTSWTEGVVCTPDREVSMEGWWNDAMLNISGKVKIRRANIMIYSAWHIWKERNRRIFENKSVHPRRILQMIKDELELRASACRGLQEHLVS
jgi:hypothetical protein